MMRGTKQPFQYAQMWGKAGGSHVAQPVPRWVTCDANEFVSLLNAEKLNPCSEDEWRRIMGLLRQTEESQEAKVKRAVNGFIQHCKAKQIAPPVVKPEPVKNVEPVKVIGVRRKPKSRCVEKPYAPNKATNFNILPGEIIAYLRKHKQATNKELARGLGREYSSVKDATKRMSARGELQPVRVNTMNVVYCLPGESPQIEKQSFDIVRMSEEVKALIAKCGALTGSQLSENLGYDRHHTAKLTTRMKKAGKLFVVGEIVENGQHVPIYHISQDMKVEPVKPSVRVQPSSREIESGVKLILKNCNSGSRVPDVFNLLCVAGPLSTRQLQRKLSTHRSTVENAIKALVGMGIVEDAGESINQETGRAQRVYDVKKKVTS